MQSFQRIVPRTAPYRQAAGTWFKRYVRRLWQSRGGGFYGFVATLMFLYLEILDIAGDVVDLGGGRLSLGWIISFVVSNMVELLMNTIRAALWPITWLQQFGVGLVSAGLLGAAYIGYLGVRPQVMRWLGDDPAPAGGRDTVPVETKPAL
ncbi:MAG TPA: hypothetical protein VK929_01065 [Longimicrobiales bacterium]|nr:hypothetical protein [Longimicrobiales bacterium]